MLEPEPHDAIRECAKRHPAISEEGLRRFQTGLLDELCDLLVRLLNAERKSRIEYGDGYIPREPGVYLFSDAEGKPLYVGQSQNLRQRTYLHCRARASQEQASLAFRIAKKTAAGANGDISGYRAVLAKRADFKEHFDAAKDEVANMPLQYALEKRPDLRTVFEVFATYALGTEEYNLFQTH